MALEINLMSRRATHDFMRDLIVLLIGAVYFFASWTHAFAVGQHGTLPNIFFAASLCVFVVLSWSQSGTFKFRVRTEDLALYMFLTLTAISGILLSNQKTLNYQFAYLFSYFGLAVLLREMIASYGEVRKLLVANFCGVLLVSIFVLSEFFLNTLYQFDLQQFLLRTTPADALYFVFPRVYGFSEEPTYLAWYYNTLGLLAMSFLWCSTGIGLLIKSFIATVILTGYLLTFSAAGFLLLPISLGLVFLLQKIAGVPAGDGSRNLSKVLIAVSAAFIAVASFAIVWGNAKGFPVSEFLEGFINKVTMQQSGDGFRAPQWEADIEKAMQHPFLGYGPGYTSSLGQFSSLNLFLFVAVEQGVVASVSLLLFYVAVGIRLLTMKFQYKNTILVAYFAGVFHLVTMTQHYHPCLWLLIAFAYLLQGRQSTALRTDYR